MSETVPGSTLFSNFTVGSGTGPIGGALNRGLMHACKGENRRVVVPPEMMAGDYEDEMEGPGEQYLTSIDVMVKIKDQRFKDYLFLFFLMQVKAIF